MPASSKEAPYPLNTVEPPLPANNSHPSPVFENGEGGFQTPTAGNYAPQNRVVNQSSPKQRDNKCPSSAESISVYYQNVRGLRTKIDDFFIAALDCNYDVIVLTETWLDARLLSTQFFGDKYTVFRTDRCPLNSQKTRGGGVLIAVSSRLTCFLDPALISYSLEQLWVRIKCENKHISIGVLYLPPDRRNDLSCVHNHLDSIRNVMAGLKHNDIFLQFDDYNQPRLLWEISDDGLPKPASNSILSASASALIDGMCFNELAQLNMVSNQNGRYLDLVFANEPALDCCAVRESIDPLVNLDADHPALYLLLMLPTPIVYDESPVAPTYNFRRSDFEALQVEFAQIDWSPIETAQNIDEGVEYFCDTINRIFQTHVPLKRPVPKPPWSNCRLRSLKRLRAAALRQYSNHRNAYTKQHFTRCSNDYRLYNRFLYGKYVVRMQRDLRQNPKRFWSFVDSKRKESGLPSSMHFEERWAQSYEDKCELFASHFMHAFNSHVATNSQIENATRQTPENVFDFRCFRINEQDVGSAIRKLKSSAAVGPDVWMWVSLVEQQKTANCGALYDGGRIYGLVSCIAGGVVVAWLSSFLT
ncbi:uncharacterized protein LOC134207532 [Armigeres subalbatus]|uniref:uncharacterized protein LOC134207532 n=1 Tax=Armigeres subalbatus TaxID=124917 RepID=UPI002ED42822